MIMGSRIGKFGGLNRVARIRTVKPDFWTDETLTECSLSARLMFIGLFNFADDNGNLDRSSKQIKMKIFPADTIDCEPLVLDLIAHGVLIEYSVNGKKYLHIKGFKKHQVINRPSKTSIPEPESETTHGGLSEDSVTEGNGREGNGKEGDIGDNSPKSKRFTPPTIEQVREYCDERNNGIDPARFVNHYQASGWKRGKSGTPIKDWKACVRYWEQNQEQNSSEVGSVSDYF